ncbi:TPA: hypothetical protein ACNVSR_005067 [Klebsiella pneumoniae]|uniref:hypothetical protein n=1 Tax=Klebsiella TaxID=570 RepID=UPI0011E3E048|nr:MULTISPECIES: hypothetical protein [Klebsiella]EKU3970310.1 hypothetical protein [Klebsiella pneumoniae]EKZ9532321.1 hypothetical protein [Klebsiella pneumoniae]ELA2648266.1 hypothetical protein [Klebsiella pneumoniae]TYG09992.1 hypothetical protein DJ548_04525 [Klebsiella grimontii]VAT13071.1 Uncharacterised protein [Klebsiella pneumoniae]
MVKKCVFCGNNSDINKLTKEHVLPKWLKKIIHQEKWHWYISSYGMDAPKQRLIKGQTIFDSTISAVCEQCNNGWMSSKLEEPVSKLLPDLIKGNETVLNKAQKYLISLWAVKTAFIRVLLDGENVLPESYYRDVSELKIPYGINVILCSKVLGSSEVRNRALRAKDNFGGHVFIFGMEIGSLLLIVSSFSTLASAGTQNQEIFKSKISITNETIHPCDDSISVFPLPNETDLAIDEIINPAAEYLFPHFLNNKVTMKNMKK